MPLWAILGVFASGAGLVIGWLVWTLSRSAASDSASVDEEYNEFLRAREEQAASQEAREDLPERRGPDESPV